MADSPAKASSATLQPGIIEPGNKGALKMTPAVLSVEHMLNCQVRAADARHAAAAHGAQEALDEQAVAVDKEASVGKQRQGRGEHLYGVGHEASPITELTHGRLADSSTGQSDNLGGGCCCQRRPLDGLTRLRGLLGSPRPFYQPEGSGHGPEPRRRPPGRRFVLHRTFGPRLGYAALGPCPCRPSSAACCCCWSPARRLPEPCRCSYHDPATSPCLAPIYSLLTRPLAVRISFLPSLLRVDSLQACESGLDDHR
jgi:hypothetical protein